VNGDDILWAMKSLGFDDAVVVLTQYLQKIREVCMVRVDVCVATDGPSVQRSTLSNYSVCSCLHH
jgi:hypothetical protein